MATAALRAGGNGAVHTTEAIVARANTRLALAVVRTNVGALDDRAVAARAAWRAQAGAVDTLAIFGAIIGASTSACSSLKAVLAHAFFAGCDLLTLTIAVAIIGAHGLSAVVSNEANIAFALAAFEAFAVVGALVGARLDLAVITSVAAAAVANAVHAETTAETIQVACSFRAIIATKAGGALAHSLGTAVAVTAAIVLAFLVFACLAAVSSSADAGAVRA